MKGNSKSIFQFRISTLLVLVAVVAIFLGKVSYDWRVAEQRAKIIKDIEAQGAFTQSAEFAVPLAGQTDYICIIAHDLPDAKFKQIVDDAILLKSPVGLSLDSNKFASDEWMNYLKKIPQLVYLDIRDTKITDAGFRYIGEMKELRNLNVSELAIGNEGLLHLSSLCNLEKLYMYNTHLSDDGLAALSQMKHLTILCLGPGNKIKGHGLQHIANLVDLIDLDLREVEATDEDFQHLKNMSKLKWLHMGNTKVTDASVNLLSNFSKLEMLSIPGTGISQAGVHQLISKLPNLKYIGLSQNQISADDLQFCAQRGIHVGQFLYYPPSK